jgi:hypothetical protein
MLTKILGVLFLLGAIACAVLAYMCGGPIWDDTFDFERMMREADIFVLGTLGCLLFGFALITHKKKSASP